MRLTLGNRRVWMLLIGMVACAVAGDCLAKPIITVQLLIEAEPYRSKLEQMQLPAPGTGTRLEALQQSIAEQFAATCASHLRFVEWVAMHKLPANKTAAAGLRIRLINQSQQVGALRLVEFDAWYRDAAGQRKNIQFANLKQFVLYKIEQGPDPENFGELESDLLEKLGVMRSIDSPSGWIATDANRKDFMREMLQFIPIPLSQTINPLPNVLVVRVPIPPGELAAGEKSILKVELRAAPPGEDPVVLRAEKREDQFDPSPGFTAAVIGWSHSVQINAPEAIAALVALITNHPAATVYVLEYNVDTRQTTAEDP